ncbi:hypothetical protein [Varunaivibrio sulfuroxidans]|uniref:Uncharacterized protein n=1 Tax=Varunaivibrio sulfuroxidans TaxID=1773489 RepID=A0A4R3JBN6_9PROT|nr:hypothetical protein [Varunaivibrio sulfuroxidans]TCS63054.1 hypothetical protein EDD55_104145 [Varunaivibrio sulfuroxidans]WES31874.1 hypothetical protein P3M64_05820 [Varunaivibrio sulfuroxidans]
MKKPSQRDSSEPLSEPPSEPPMPMVNADVAKRSSATTKTLVRTFVDFMMSNNMLTKQIKTENFDRNITALVREIDVILRNGFEQHGFDVMADVRAAYEAKAGQKPKETGNRHKFLLRLIAGRFSHLFAAPKAAIFPRNIVAGFDDYLQKLLGDMLYDELNQEAQLVLSNHATDDDQEIWKKIGETERDRRFAYNILIRILLRFSDFTWARKNFISIVNNVTERQSGFIFDEDHFCLMFNALFSDIFQIIWNDQQSLKLDFMFGNGTVDSIDRIRDEFRAYQKSLGAREEARR